MKSKRIRKYPVVPSRLKIVCWKYNKNVWTKLVTETIMCISVVGSHPANVLLLALVTLVHD